MTLLSQIQELNDGEFGVLMVALKNEERKRSLATTRQVGVGDTVVFNSTVHPRYLEGTKAIVTKVNDKSLGIRLDVDADPRALRRFGSRPIRCPRTLLDPVLS